LTRLTDTSLGTRRELTRQQLEDLDALPLDASPARAPLAPIRSWRASAGAAAT